MTTRAVQTALAMPARVTVHHVVALSGNQTATNRSIVNSTTIHAAMCCHTNTYGSRGNMRELPHRSKKVYETAITHFVTKTDSDSPITRLVSAPRRGQSTSSHVGVARGCQSSAIATWDVSYTSFDRWGSSLISPLLTVRLHIR